MIQPLHPQHTYTLKQTLLSEIQRLQCYTEVIPRLKTELCSLEQQVQNKNALVYEKKIYLSHYKQKLKTKHRTETTKMQNLKQQLKESLRQLQHIYREIKSIRNSMKEQHEETYLEEEWKQVCQKLAQLQNSKEKLKYDVALFGLCQSEQHKQKQANNNKKIEEQIKKLTQSESSIKQLTEKLQQMKTDTSQKQENRTIITEEMKVLTEKIIEGEIQLQQYRNRKEEREEKLREIRIQSEGQMKHLNTHQQKIRQMKESVEGIVEACVRVNKEVIMMKTKSEQQKRQNKHKLHSIQCVQMLMGQLKTLKPEN